MDCTESILVDYRKLLFSHFDKIKEITKPFSDTNGDIRKCVDEIGEIYNSKLEEIKPQIMIYGIYNAGKSSIINELIKEDRAAVADRPMTDKVDYFEWNGYLMADTPGVGAPIKHEEITQNHLKKADVVLFVMSTNGSTERKQNYDRMKDIISAGKKVIIVLNDKDGVLGKPDDDTISTLKSQVVENMHLVGIPAVDNQYYIVPVNAKRAHKGRTENKQGLYSSSNIEELERVILSELRKTDSFMVMHNSILEIEKILEKIINFIQDESTEDVNSIQKIIDCLRVQEKEIREGMSEFVYRKSSRLARELPDEIWHVIKESQGKNEEDIQNAINEITMNKVSGICGEVQDEYQLKMKEITDDLQDDIEALVSHLGKIGPSVENQINVDKVHLNDVSVQEMGEQNGQMIGTLTAISSAAAMAGEFLVSDLGKKVLLEVGKTVAGKAIIPYVSLIAPILGPAGWLVTGISIIKSLMTAGSSKEAKQRRADEQQNELRRRQAEAEAHAKHELHQKCVYMADDLADTLMGEINQLISETFAKIFAPLKDNIEELQNRNDSVLWACNELGVIYNELDSVDERLSQK